MPDEIVYTVSEIQNEVRAALEDNYGSIWVEGEVSDFRQPRQGHLYFTLKDERAQLAAIMWQSAARRLKFDLENGQAVRARGNLTVYPAFGKYQMIVQRLEPIGAGPLQIAFEQLRRRLEAEGLFEPAHKQPLPAFPRRIALVTSARGAAVQDLIKVATRRWPPAQLVVVPVKVQGADAAPLIAAGLRAADALGCDVIVTGRGGGSLEDLWAFNEEPVARAIFECSTPVVSAVGHEIDTTIADMVADVRAATPSAAAELVTPDAAEVRAALDGSRRRLARALEDKVRGFRLRLDHLKNTRVLRQPELIVADLRQRVDAFAGKLEALSPLKVLARGYSVTRKDGKVVTRAADVTPGDDLRTQLADGEVRSRVV